MRGAIRLFLMFTEANPGGYLPLPLTSAMFLGFVVDPVVHPMGFQPLAKSGRWPLSCVSWPSLGGLPLHSFRHKSAAGSPGVEQKAVVIGLAADLRVSTPRTRRY